MKNLLLLVCGLVTLCLCMSCNDVGSQGLKQGDATLPLDIYVFVDKSKSVSFDDSAISQKCSEAVKALLNQMKHPGDRVSLYYIHKNTKGASAVLSYVIPPIDLGRNTNTIQKNERRRLHAEAAVAERREVFSKLREMLHTPNDSNSERGTDIIGTLEIISGNSDSFHDRRMVLLTDGIQDANGFGKVAPKNTDQVVTLASKDVKLIPQYYSISKQTGPAQALMVLPISALKSTHNSLLDKYWRKVFESYGISFNCE